MKSNVYRLEIIARMIKESNTLSSDPEDYFEGLKEEFLEEALKATNLEVTYLQCFTSLARLKTLRHLKEKYPEMVYSVSDILIYDAIEALQFTIKDFSDVFKKLNMDHMKDFLLKDLKDFLIREGLKLTYIYTIDWKLDSNNDLVVIIKTDIKQNH